MWSVLNSATKSLSDALFEEDSQEEEAGQDEPAKAAGDRWNPADSSTAMFGTGRQRRGSNAGGRGDGTLPSTPAAQVQAGGATGSSSSHFPVSLELFQSPSVSMLKDGMKTAGQVLTKVATHVSGAQDFDAASRVRSAMEALKQQVLASSQENEQLLAEVAMLRQQLQQQAQQQQQAQGRPGAAGSVSADEAGVAAAALAEERQAAAAAQQQLSSLQGELHQAQVQVQVLTEALAQRDSQWAAELQQEREAAAAAAGPGLQNNGSRDMQAELESLRAAHHAALAQLAELQASSSRQSDEAAKLTEQLDMLRSLYDDEKQFYSKVQAELRAEQDVHGQSRLQLQAATAEAAAQKEAVAALQAERTSLQSRVDQLAAELAAAQRAQQELLQRQRDAQVASSKEVSSDGQQAAPSAAWQEVAALQLQLSAMSEQYEAASTAQQASVKQVCDALEQEAVLLRQQLKSAWQSEAQLRAALQASNAAQQALQLKQEQQAQERLESEAQHELALSAARSDCAALQAKLQRVEAEWLQRCGAEVASTKEAAAEQVQVLQSRMQDLEASLSSAQASWQQRLQEQEEATASAQADAAALRAAAASTQAQWDARLAGVQAQLDAARSWEQQLLQQLEHATQAAGEAAFAQVAKLQQQLASSQEELLSMQDAITAMQQQARAAQEQLASAKAAAEAERSAKEQLASELLQLQGTCSNLAAEKQEQAERLSRLEAGVNGVHGQSSSTQLQAALTEISSLAAAREALEQTVAQQAAQIEALQAQLQAHAARSPADANSQEQEDAGALRQQVAELQAALAEADKSHERTRAQLARLKTQMLSEQEDEETKVSWRVSAEVRLVQEQAAEALAHVQAALATEQAQVSALAAEVRSLNEALTYKEREVANLQAALGELSYESEAAERLRLQVATAQNRGAQLQAQLADAQQQLQAALASASSAQSASQQAQESLAAERAARVRTLEECAMLRRALDQSMRQVSLLNTESSGMVDRRVLAKLLVTYFERGHSADVLSLMARMLSLSEEEQRKVGLLRKPRGLLSTVAGMPFAVVKGGVALGSAFITGGGTKPGGSAAGNDSLGDQWVQFLLAQAEADDAAQRMALAAQSRSADHGGGGAAAMMQGAPAQLLAADGSYPLPSAGQAASTSGTLPNSAVFAMPVPEFSRSIPKGEDSSTASRQQLVAARAVREDPFTLSTILRAEGGVGANAATDLEVEHKPAPA